jgi:adenine deaminase
MHHIKGRLVDIVAQTITPAEITIEEGKIQSITPIDEAATESTDPTTSSFGPPPYPSESASGLPLHYILPGFIDAHVHIESSLLIPSEFARLAVVHGTIATVSDPHEIANVVGIEGVEFMMRNGESVPFYFNFGAPSCVPATTFESSGATLPPDKVEQLLQDPRIKYLSEMMNFPGVLHKDPDVMAKIAAAKRLGKPVDGHAPGLRGEEARQYIGEGISTDHECFTAEEALDKLQAGMKILIREGSAAKNFDALVVLLNDWSDQMMFCSDDKHPDSLVAGHIDRLCARAVAKGIDLFKVLKVACHNPREHYKLGSGFLRVGDPADFIVVEDVQHFKVMQTWLKGQCVAENGVTKIGSTHLPTPASMPAPTSSGGLLTASPINHFNAEPHNPGDFAYLMDKWGEQENVEQVYCIEALDGQLITNRLVIGVTDVLPADGRLNSNPAKDILKIVVVNRYHAAPVAKSFIRNFGLKRGAIASSVAHDSHNIVCVGVDDESICRAVNLIIAQKGGLSCIDPGQPGSAAQPSAQPATTPAVPSAAQPAVQPTAPSIASGGPQPISAPAEFILPLPVAGLMSLGDGFQVAESYTALDHMAKDLGSNLAAPFMTLSFMALLVIPHLKLSDLGLFDGDKFALI